MDHMRISGNEPSSVILSQTKLIQNLKMMTRKCLNKLKTKRDLLNINIFKIVFSVIWGIQEISIF